jgi:hypothetical protein
VDRVDVSTVVYVPPPEAFEFLLEFPRYPRYTEYLKAVTQCGDGTPGTEYDMRFGWWKVGYTLRSEVVGTDPPERIDWRIIEEIDASGAWIVEEASDEVPADVDVETASRIRFRAGFDPSTAEEDAVRLPSFVDLDWVIDRVKPLAIEEAKRVVARAVTDLEGRRREIELFVDERPDV